MTLSKRISIALTSLAVLYILICLVMFITQRNFLYFPNKQIDKPQTYGLNDFAVTTLQTRDLQSIQAWYHPARENYPTIIYFHGNGGDLKNRAEYFHLLSDAGFGILGIDYRGYGASTGSPSEQGFYLDARATMDYALDKLSLPPEKLVIYGESIGTGVAVQMSTEYRSSALVLQSPFTDISVLAKKKYPFLPVDILLRDHFDSLSKIKNIKAPLLVFHGRADDVVPVRYGEELFASASEPKQAIYFDDVGHNNFHLPQLTQDLKKFCIDYAHQLTTN